MSKIEEIKQKLKEYEELEAKKWKVIEPITKKQKKKHIED